MTIEMESFQLNQTEKKIVRLAALGGMLEFYDFIIYGIFSVYFVQQFFPSETPLLSIIKSYLVFILGYLARPMGGLIFSHIGDEFGRKRVLILTIVLMGASSLGIGVLPTYEQIGILAPCLLMILRIIQGLALGGELPSTYVYISETLAQKQGTGFGITMAGVNSGLLLGMFVNVLINYFLSPDEIIAYGWRIPFIFGGLICVVSYRIRKTLSETVAFQRIHNKPAFPLLHLIKNHLKTVLIGTAITSIMSGLVVVAIVYMPTYLNKILNVDQSWVSYCIVIGMLANVLTIYGTGKLANRINPRTILFNLLVSSIMLIPMSYWLINLRGFPLLLGIIILCILEGVAAAMIPLCLCLLFATPIRLTGVALCYNIGFTLFGGMAPVVISTFINLGYNLYLTPIIYLLLITFICGIGLTFLKRHEKLMHLQEEISVKYSG